MAYAGNIGKNKKSVYDSLLNPAKKEVKKAYSGNIGKTVATPNNTGSALGYIGGTIGTGIVSAFEGIKDLGVAGVAAMLGDKEYAKYQFQNNVTGGWRQKLDEQYNPGKGMKFVGDVGSGIGQSLSYAAMALLTAGIGTGASAGASAGAKVASVAAQNAPIFLSASGSGISEAVGHTGELGAKEVGYGLSTGLMETGLEKLSSVGALVGKVTGKTGVVEKGFSKVIKNTTARGILSSAAGEFIEEASSEIGSTGLKRLYGIDSDASTSAGEVFRAGMIGALSGGILGAGTAGITSAITQRTGSKIVDKGMGDETAKTAKYLTDNIKSNHFANVDQDIVDLRNIVAAYNQNPNKTGLLAKAQVGKMSGYLAKIENKSAIGALRASIMSQATQETVDKLNVTISHPQGGKWTLADIKADKDNITTMYAAFVHANRLIALEDTTSEKIEAEVYTNTSERLKATEKENVADISAIADNEYITRQIGNGKIGVVIKTSVGYKVGVYESAQDKTAQWSLSTSADDAYQTLFWSAHTSTETAQRTEPTSVANTESKADKTEQRKFKAKKRSEKKSEPKKPSSEIKKAEEKKAVNKEKTKKPVDTAPKAKETSTETEKDIVDNADTNAKETKPTGNTEDGKAKMPPSSATASEHLDKTFTAEEFDAVRAFDKNLDLYDTDTQRRMLTAARTAKENGATEQQGVDAALLARDLSVDITYSNLITADGMYTTLNGDKTIVLRPTGERKINTLLHEVTHRLEGSPVYKEFAEVVKAAVGKEGFEKAKEAYKADFEAFRKAENKKIKDEAKKIKPLTEEELDAEAIADLCAIYLKDTSFLQKRASQSTLKRAWLTITDMLSRFKKDNKAYATAARHIQSAYEKMIGADALAGIANMYGYGYRVNGNTLYSVGYALTKAKDIEGIVNAICEQTGFAEKDVRKYIESETKLVKKILTDGDMAVYDYSGDDSFSYLKKNSDYKQGSVDFNNKCPKRVAYTALFDRFMKDHPDISPTAEDLEDIRQIMIKNDMTVACAPCYVEDRRQLLGNIATGFINVVEDIDSYMKSDKYQYSRNGRLKSAFEALKMSSDKYIPTYFDLLTYEGIAKLRSSHPELTEAFERFNKARGQASGRLIEGEAEYKRQILNMGKNTIGAKNKLGGLRMFSLSDFDPMHLVDIIQIVTDASSKGLMIQAYTKNPAFAKIVKDTRIKLNRSLIPKGNGYESVNGVDTLVYDTVEGIDINDKDFFDSTDSDSVGNIVIGINKAQIRLAMKDNFIDFIIPFHTGQSMHILQKKGIQAWENFKDYQTDKSAETNTTSAKQINIYTDVIDAYAKRGTPIKNKVEFVNAFLATCKENGLIPRFEMFLDKNAEGDYVYTEGYHKFLVDYKLFDKNGNILPQMPVVPKFDDAFNEKILREDAKTRGADKYSENVYKAIESKLLSNHDTMYSPSVADTTMAKIRFESNEKPKQTIKEKAFGASVYLKDAVEKFKIAFVNQQQGIENYFKGKKTSIPIQARIQAARAGEAYGIGAITQGQYDYQGNYVGESYAEILKPLWDEKKGKYDKDLYAAYSNYALNLHNINRQAVEKPVFDVPPETSRVVCDEYEKKYPYFKDIASKLQKFHVNLNQYRVDTGLISQKQADKMNEMYPNYIPTYREGTFVGTGSLDGKYNLKVKSAVKAAKGSDLDIADPLMMDMRQTIGTYKQGRVNMVAKELYSNADGQYVAKKGKRKLNDEEAKSDYSHAMDKASNSITFYDNGEAHTIQVAPGIFNGFEGFTTMDTWMYDNILFEGISGVNSMFKRLVTSLNPVFTLRNIPRDFQDALVYSKFGSVKFTAALEKAYAEIAKNGDLWKQYIAVGGLQSSVYEFEKGVTHGTTKRGMKKQSVASLDWLQKLENASIITEAAPRLAEFMLSRKSGKSVEESLVNAADVTVNFGRSGRIGRILNGTVMPFLNPGIQGLDKTIRTAAEAKGAKAWASLITKAFLLGMAPVILSNLLYGGDDEYNDLKDTVKENNYILKIGNTWVKIPRGRLLSVFSGLYNRTSRQVAGKTVDWLDYAKNVSSQATPMDSITRTVFSPFTDVRTNTTWYGGTIENMGDEYKNPEERYDEYTSKIAILVGKATGYSPKKLDYLLDQYSGVFGDFLIPATATARRNAFGSQFTVNVNSSSRVSQEFNDLYNEAVYANSAGDDNGYYLKKYLSEYKKTVYELWDEITLIQTSNLPSKDKDAQVKALRATINQIYKSALTDYQSYQASLEAARSVESSYTMMEITAKNWKALGADKIQIGKYAVLFDGFVIASYETAEGAQGYLKRKVRDDTYAESIRLLYGAERALKHYGEEVSQKASALAKAGIDNETYYNIYIAAKGKDKEEKEAMLIALGLSEKQRSLVLCTMGYTSYKADALSYLKSMNLPKEDRNSIIDILNLS